MSLEEYLLGSDADEVLLETIELKHSNFSKSYFYVRNAINGLSARIETGGIANFEYIPLLIEPNSTEDDLSYSLGITFGDLGEILPVEFANIRANDNMLEEPTVVYRAYRSSDLESMVIGPVTLKVKTFSFNKTGAVFQAESSRDNSTSTGVNYGLNTFWMLRAFTKEVNE